MIRVQHVSKHYSGSSEPALDAVSLEVARGESLVLVGESGSGKSTLLKMLNGLVTPSSGDVHIDNTPMAQHDLILLRRRIGYVFQGIGLLPHYTVADNIGLIPRLLGWSEARIQERLHSLMALMSLPMALATRFPEALSGGQQQRVGVARALAAEPDVLLMDEPFGALDPITRDQLQSELQRIREQLQFTLVMVTHDITEALLLGDRIGVMYEGKLLQIGRAATLLQEPAHPYVAQLMATPQRQAEALAASLRAT